MINLEKEIREQPRVLSEVYGANEKNVKALVSEAKKRGIKAVTFAARGTSDHAAIYGQYLLAIEAGVPAGLATPLAVSKYGADIDYTGQLVVGISQSGMAEDVLKVIEDAKKHGALTASVTNNEDSPLAKAVDYSLFCNAGKDRTGVVSAIILYRLGFDDRTIIDDYMKTRENLMDILSAYVKEHPEVDHFTVVPKEENIAAVLDYLKKESS